MIYASVIPIDSHVRLFSYNVLLYSRLLCVLHDAPKRGPKTKLFGANG
jgi:hypothetical protein